MRLTESEWQIMKALWQDHPATARDVAERLPDENQWAYTTIKTMLTRLVTKTAVSECKRGNTSIYEPLISQEKARGSALGALINQAFDGAVEPFLNFLAQDRKLSDKQKKQLQQVLDAEDLPDQENE